MLVNAKLPTSLRGEALLIVCHINNRITFIKLKVSPYELWKKRKPNLNYFRVWVCLAFYSVLNSKMIKLRPGALKENFVGYAEDLKAYKNIEFKF